MDKCSIYNCDEKCFEESQECILHCKKDDWYDTNQDGSLNWDKSLTKLTKMKFKSVSKVLTIRDFQYQWIKFCKKSNENIKKFWKKILLEISNVNNILDNKDAKKDINDTEDEYNTELFKYEFNQIIFPASSKELHYEPFYGLNKEFNLYFNNCRFLGKTDFKLIRNAKNISFSDCSFFDEVKFEKNQFNNLFLFENCSVHKEITFQNIIFEGTTSFIRTKFYNEINFIHTKFESLALFSDSKMNLLNLENTFFKKEANFLGATIEVKNRETARIIKHSFEKQGNIIESNRFYALEMKEMDKDLTKSFWDKPSFEFFTFKFHSFSSEHSQNWVLPLLWIFIIGISAYLMEGEYLKCKDYDCKDFITIFLNSDIDVFVASGIFFSFSIFTVIASYFKEKVRWIVSLLFLFLFYLFITTDNTSFDSLFQQISPFSKLGKDMTAIDFIAKVIITYLIYQFVVSIRQNTRRS